MQGRKDRVKGSLGWGKLWLVGGKLGGRGNRVEKERNRGFPSTWLSSKGGEEKEAETT